MGSTWSSQGYRVGYTVIKNQTVFRGCLVISASYLLCPNKCRPHPKGVHAYNSVTNHAVHTRRAYMRFNYVTDNAVHTRRAYMRYSKQRLHSSRIIIVIQQVEYRFIDHRQVHPERFE